MSDTSRMELDAQLLAALRAGEEAAFSALVDFYTPSMKRIAFLYTNDSALADEAVQDTWVGVLRGLDRFEGRSSLKTWLFSILTNRAKTWAQREGRYSSLSDELDEEEVAVSSDRFLPEGEPWAGHWAVHPTDWSDIPETRILSDETQRVIQMAIDRLPVGQRTVIILRDIDGWTSQEVCNVLELTETNQRVLLHRARSKVRQAIEKYLED